MELPWSLASLPGMLDGAQGRFRGSHEQCGLNATTDTEAIAAWLTLHEPRHATRLLQ
ncbi:hypothetical protein [Paraburkholderia dinghuensis]|uniref:hypothetical protein n=1 Tax=Paraburkholderia dinghuensis TaxID=2305225 RepID=UPI001623FF97|nr:hypothetical protein [Paraburkholderia dinghuensis]